MIFTATDIRFLTAAGAAAEYWLDEWRARGNDRKMAVELQNPETKR
ncbi:MAG: hypothetical protein M3O26_01440 [Pseudomonadota bacterium]|nr:hypothetical protein [Pseudomonadota bacterium]